MCGRYTYYPGEFSDLRIGFNLAFGLPELKQRFNISPGQEAPIIAAKEEGNCLEMFRWGLIPSWAKEASIGYRMINARSETVAYKPALKRLIGKRHCLVLANGFFEWRKEGKKKFPMYFKLQSGEIFTFPGLWDAWKQPDGNILLTYTLLTTTPNELVKPIHGRMPVIFSEDAAKQWLVCKPETAPECLELLKPFPAEKMEAYEVSPLVNNPRNDSPECVRPIEG
jgi:putative SOS response-associated peptidase YedK